MSFLRSINHHFQPLISSRFIKTIDKRRVMAPVVLILGAGPRVGAAISEAFDGDGYKVAVAARKGTDSTADNGFLSVKADFTKPDSIAAVFEKVEAEFGTAPSVVVYNAAALTPPPDKDSALSVPVANLESDINVNVVSPYVAAQNAIKGWQTLPAETKKLFVYTGNILNQVVMPVPLMLTLGIGKAASAYWIGLADSTYSAQGYRFIYTDERYPDGKLKGNDIDGPAHGEFYTQLAKSAEGVPWLATFVKNKGYVQFE